jgi:hypothetical protein
MSEAHDSGKDSQRIIFAYWSIEIGIGNWEWEFLEFGLTVNVSFVVVL